MKPSEMTDAEVEAMTQKFLTAQPQWLAHDVRYFPVSGQDEPQLYLSKPATKAFMRWLSSGAPAARLASAERMIDALGQERTRDNPIPPE